MNKLIAVFGGSFNPPTYAHMKIITYMINKTQIDKLLIVPCGFRIDKKCFA